MGMIVVCQTCGARRTLPTSLYEAKVRGRVVTIACKQCGATITVDGTVPPPAPGKDEGPGDRELASALVIPKPALLPASATRPAPRPVAKADGYAATPGVARARERQISHVDGPISERGPSARIGRYALFEQFAAGGMATVHFGRLDGAGGFSRVVAIKRLLPHLLTNRDFTDMLLNEARMAARVRHPNVVATLDVVASKGDVLLVLDYVEGEALSTLCRAQAKQKGDLLSVPVVVGIMQDVLHGLTAVHEATDEKGRALDLVHRDISPPNVLVGVDGVSRVLDFGIAKALQHLDDSVTGRRMGKMGYMSPEQIRNERLTQRSDVFSTGIIFWELLAMRRLFPADQPEERMESILRGGYPRPSSLRADLSPELEAVVMKALETSPEARFATMREFSEALEPHVRPAARREIGEWVSSLAQVALGERTRMVARLENWREGPQIPLNSSPFASEFPPVADASADAMDAHWANTPTASIVPRNSDGVGDARKSPSRPAPPVASGGAAQTSGPTPVSSASAAGTGKPSRAAVIVSVLLAVVFAALIGYVFHR